MSSVRSSCKQMVLSLDVDLFPFFSPPFSKFSGKCRVWVARLLCRFRWNLQRTFSWNKNDTSSQVLKVPLWQNTGKMRSQMWFQAHVTKHEVASPARRVIRALKQVKFPGEPRLPPVSHLLFPTALTSSMGLLTLNHWCFSILHGHNLSVREEANIQTICTRTPLQPAGWTLHSTVPFWLRCSNNSSKYC